MKTWIFILLTILCTFVVFSYTQKVHIDLPQDYDQDEFEIESTNQQIIPDVTVEAHSTVQDTISIDDSTSTTTESLPVKKTIKDFYMEICFIVFLIAYAANYFIGKNTNRNIVKLWGKKFQPLFDDNFAKVGNKNNFTILKVNANTFTFVCSGRNNCYGAQVTLDLKKRQDLISVLLDLVGYSDPDKMTIEVALNTMEPLVFAVIRQKALKKFKADHSDVEMYCNTYNYGNLSSNYAILADTQVLPSLFLYQEVIDVLNSSESLFESLLFTDHSVINPKYPKSIQGIFKFKVQDIDKLYKFGQMMIHYIDVVSNASLGQYRAQADKLRSKAKEEMLKQKHTERQEEAQKKKYEKIQKEKEAVSKLSADEQRKYNEKEHKKLLKKKMSSKSKIVFG